MRGDEDGQTGRVEKRDVGQLDRDVADAGANRAVDAVAQLSDAGKVDVAAEFDGDAAIGVDNADAKSPCQVSQLHPQDLQTV